MRKLVHFICRSFVVMTLAITGLSVVQPLAGFESVSHAQTRERQKGFFELLFQRNRRQPETRAPLRATPQPRVVQPRQNQQRRAAPQRQRAAAPPPPEPSVEKAENARRILIVGDFVADGMGQGLEDAFADSENVLVIRRASGSSGFVRDDFYNWSSEIGPLIEETNPDIVVMQIGSNDRQVMRVDGTREKVRSDAWTEEYIRRVNAFAAQVRENNRLLVWVGAPPFKFRSMSADMLAFNELYRTAAEDVDGYFVDIWDGFVDENGGFVLTGDDIKGQKVRLRVSDGINFTKAGRRKIAFYVERQLQILLGDATAPLLTSLANDRLPMMMLPPLQTEAELVRTNPLGFTDVELDGGATLLGDVEQGVANRNPLAAKSYRLRLIEDGLPPPAREGRAGTFVLPPASGG
ncbi:MAG: DUF459 domain-containing protein [Pseudomonadota bacterium]